MRSSVFRARCVQCVLGNRRSNSQWPGEPMQLEVSRDARNAMQDRIATALRPRRTIIVDAERSSQRTLHQDLVQLGCACQVVSEISELRAELSSAAGAPDLIAAEYRLAGK